MFLATVLNCTKNIYISKEKELVRLNDCLLYTSSFTILCQFTMTSNSTVFNVRVLIEP